MTENRTFLAPLDTSLDAEPRIMTQTHEDLGFLEPDNLLLVQLAAFPQFNEDLRLPQLRNVDEQTLHSQLPTANAANVPGWKGWRRHIALGKYAGTLWLTKGETVVGVLWNGYNVERTELIELQSMEDGRGWIARLKKVERRLPETEAVQYLDFPLQIVDEPVESVLPSQHSLCKANEPKEPIQLEVLAAYTKGTITAIRQELEWSIPGLDSLDHHRLLLQETANWTFMNSKVPVQVRVRFLEVSDYDDELTVSGTWQKLKLGKEAPFDHIHQKRGRADVVALVGELGGSGYAADGEQAPNDGFLVVDWKDACFGFEFTHELGHILGADHQCGITPNPGTCPFARAHCHNGDVKWSTVMARSCSGQRAPLWSSARGELFEHGDADRDNVRAIWGMAPKVAKYGENAAKKVEALTGLDSDPECNEVTKSRMISPLP